MLCLQKGGGPKSKVGVGGESAGGKIAASVAHDVNDLSFQVQETFINFENDIFKLKSCIIFNVHNLQYVCLHDCVWECV